MAVLILRQFVVGLQTLEPDADLDQVIAVSDGHLIFRGEKIAHRVQIAAGIRPSGGDGRLGIGSRAAANDDGSDRLSLHKAGEIYERHPVEEERGAGKAERRFIEHDRREQMRLGNAGHLLAQGFNVVAQGIYGRRIVKAVVDGVDGVGGVFGRKRAIDARGAEILADGLQRMAEGFGDAAAEFGTVGNGPQREKRLHAGDSFCSRGVVRDESDVANTKALTEALVVDEEKCFVFLNRAAERAAENVALEMRDRTLVEKVARVERAIAKEFVNAAVKFVCAGCGDYVHLRARALAVFRAIRICDDGEFADGVHAEQLAAGAAGRVVDFRCAGVFDAVQQEQIFLRAASRDGEHITDNGIRRADAAGALGGIIHDAGI